MLQVAENNLIQRKLTCN